MGANCLGANSLCKRKVFGVRGRGGANLLRGQFCRGESGVKLKRIFLERTFHVIGNCFRGEFL